MNARMKCVWWVCCLLGLLWSSAAGAQMNYGTTGLMNMPTADMQRDKTVMAGGSWLSHHTTVPRWWYDTWNYYVNITIFPFLEMGYTLTGHKAVATDYGNKSGYWKSYTYGKFVNQDRSWHVRLRLWKEGWWKGWTPQVVVGSNDVVGDSWHGGSLSSPSESSYGNGFLNRYFLAVTKHFEFEGVGRLGAHLTWIYSARFDNPVNAPAVGADFRLALADDERPWRRWANGITLMAEVLPGYTDVNDDLTFDESGPKYQVNIGLLYTCWRDHINAVFELGRCRYPSVSLQLKLHLK